ncbi:MAG: alpha/beta fold hydrolase [Chloroflexota bacterium]
MDIKLLPGAEPFYFPGGRIGCLCLHGLTASPQEMYWLGEHLAKQGMTVYGPRLYGHGVSPDYMLRMRWQDWYLSALDGYHLLTQTCDQIIVIGLSLGSLLALRLASAEAVAGVVAMAVPLLPLPAPATITHVLRYFVPYLMSYDQATDKIDQRVRKIQQERHERITGRVAYFKQSAVGVSELIKLQAEVKATLSRVSAPSLLVFSEKDTTVPIETLDVVCAGLSASPMIDTLRLNESDHIYTNDVEYHRVFAAVTTFVQRCTA